MSPASAIDINQESATRTMCKIPQELILLSRKTFEELASTQGGGMHITLGGLGDLFKRLGLSKEAEDRVRLEHHFREMDADGLGLVCLRDLLLFLAYNPDMVESMALAHAPKSLDTKVKAAAAVPARAQAAPAPTDADPDPSALAVVEGKAVEAMEVVLKAAPSAAEMEEAVHKAEHEAAVQVKMEALEVRARERLEEETREKEAIRHRARRDSELAPAPANGNGNGSHGCNGGGSADASVHEKAEALAARARAKEEEAVHDKMEYGAEYQTKHTNSGGSSPTASANGVRASCSAYSLHADRCGHSPSAPAVTLKSAGFAKPVKLSSILTAPMFGGTSYTSLWVVGAVAVAGVAVYAMGRSMRS